MNTWRLALRLLWRDLASGQVRVLLASLILAVTAVTTIGFVTDRAGRALRLEANRLLGGDALLRADEPIGDAVRDRARQLGLDQAETLQFPSMVRQGERLQLCEIRGIGAGFPLRGTFIVTDASDAREHARAAPPKPGTIWLSTDAALKLDARLGDTLQVGRSALRVDALVAREPDGALDYFNFAPRVFVHSDDLAATGLIQEGSRIGYRLVVAGAPEAVETFVRTTRESLARGQRLETIADARPEIRGALERADRFLGLASLIAVVLAAVAVAMAARRHGRLQLDACAVLRCLGAEQRVIVTIYVGELLALGAAASLVGVVVALGLQSLLGEWLSRLLGLTIPAPGLLPAIEGFGVGMIVLFAFAVPPILALRRVPALRVLRRDLDAREPSAWVVAVLGLSALIALLWWRAGSVALAGAMLGGIAATLLGLAVLAGALIAIVHGLRGRLTGAWRYGVANLSRRAGASVAQIAALGLGLMAILLLTLVRTDLLAQWQRSLPADAPNRFVINAQPDQVAAIEQWLATRGIARPTLFPMVRGRLVEVAGRAIDAQTYAERGERARRLAEREFNLSFTDDLARDDNEIVAGRAWTPGSERAELSVEEGLAETLGWKLGDEVAFDVAGQRLQATITSLRRVDWESFRPNFFVLAPSAAMRGYAASYITAIHVPASDPRAMPELVGEFPNLSVIDIDAVVRQVRATADQVAAAIKYVFYFALAAALLVLVAAIASTQDERLLEGAVMRALGASRRQLRWGHALEFGLIGAIAGLTAAIAAGTLSAVVAVRVFDLPWSPDWRLAAVGGAIGVSAVMFTGLVATRRVVAAPPSTLLRSLSG